MAGPRTDVADATVAGGEDDDGGDGEPSGRSPRPGRRDPRWLALVVLCVPVLLLNIEGTVLNVAIPRLVEGLGATGPQLLWIADGFGLVFACLVLTAGALADRFGRRRMLMLGVAWFGASCLAAALAPTPAALIAARCSMGVGAAIFYPTSLAMIVRLFEAPEERARAISAWAGVGTLGIVIGPLVGGALIDSFGWSAAFLLNVPISAAVLVLMPLLLDDGGPRHGNPVDVPGLLASAVGLALLLYGVIAGPEDGWAAPSVLAPLAGGAVLLAWFVRWERRCAHPMIDLALFRIREYTTASATIATVYFALVGWTLLIAQYMQFVLGIDAFGTGLALAGAAFGQLLGSLLAPRAMRGLGRNVTVALGVALLAVTTAAFAFGALVASIPLVFANRFVEGLGIGLVVIPTTDSVMRCVAPERSAVGSAVNDTTRMTSAIFGLGVLGSLLAASYGARLGALPFVPADLRAHAGSSIGSAFTVAAELPAAAAAQLQAAAREAFTGALHLTTWTTVAILSLAGAFAWARLARREPAAEASGIVPTTEIIDPMNGTDRMTQLRAAATADAPTPTGRYSQAMAAGGLCFLAGQAPFRPDGSYVGDDLEAQVRQCFANLAAVAAAAGTSLDQVVRYGVFVSSRVDLAEYNRIYAELVTQDPPPARTTILSELPGFDVEIDAVCLA